MRLIVLGSAAGGGFPQWNCGCTNCCAVREKDSDFEPRTQDAVAVTAGGPNEGSFVLLNASPDILEQIKRTRALWPRAPRHSPIRAVVLTNGDMDHVLGLFSMRESYPIALYATESVRAGLEQNIFLRTLQRFEGQLVWRTLELGRDIEIQDAGGTPIGVHVRAFAAPGKLPVHMVGHAAPSDGDNVGLVLSDAAAPKTAVYLTACAHLERLDDLQGHAALLFDGTFYREDELARPGLSRAMAKDMAHLPIDGERGSLARLSSLSSGRFDPTSWGPAFGGGGPEKSCRIIYTHINNTNPILARSSEERQIVSQAGFEIAFDGMEITV